MAQEKNFENRVKKFLKDESAWFVKYWGGGLYTKDGVPDILASINGRFVAIELKAPTGKASPIQKSTLKKIDASGGYAILLYPDEFELFKNFVNCLNQSDLKNADLNYRLLKGRWSK